MLFRISSCIHFGFYIFAEITAHVLRSVDRSSAGSVSFLNHM
jgi:hypothetical protein